MMTFDLINHKARGAGNYGGVLISMRVSLYGKDQRLRVSLAPTLLEQAGLKQGDTVSLHGHDDTLVIKANRLGWPIASTKSARGKPGRSAVYFKAPPDIRAALDGKTGSNVSANKQKQTITFKVL